MQKTGVILINTGTPRALTEDAVRDFLSKMLSDPMLISLPPFIWQPILKHFILPNRPKKTIKLYERMWDDDGSIFMRVSCAQRDALADLLDQRAGEGAYQVALSMRYSEPTISDALGSLEAGGCSRLVIVPLYPTYARVCAGTCIKEVRRVLADEFSQWQPDVAEVECFYDDPAYLQALAKSISDSWSYSPGSKLVVSCHSTVLADIEAGDPYDEQNHRLASSLAQALGIDDDDWVLSYQSRFDSRKWLQPFTSDVLEQLAQEGARDVCVVCPCFVAENIESAVEAGEQLRDVFLESADAGARYTYIPTLDDDEGLIAALANAVEKAFS